jgi:maleate isomerase
MPGEGGGRRFGVVLPSVNTIVEPLFSRLAPTGVTVHANRMLITGAATPESVLEMDRHGLEAAAVLATCQPDAILYGCTASTIVRGRAYDLELVDELQRATSTRCATATDAVVRALHHLGATRIAVASPYPDALDDLEATFFTQAGFDVVGRANLGISDTRALAVPGLDEIVELGRRACAASDADALLISCLNFRSHLAVAALESELGRPVVTATTASLWWMLRLLGTGAEASELGALSATGASSPVGAR